MAKKKTTASKSTSKASARRKLVGSIAKAAPTADMVREYNETRERRLELDRESAILKKRESQITKDLMDHVESKGGKRRSLKLGQFQISLVPGKRYVSWKAEFIRLVGTAEAEAVHAAAVPKDKLEIRVA